MPPRRDRRTVTDALRAIFARQEASAERNAARAQEQRRAQTRQQDEAQVDQLRRLANMHEVPQEQMPTRAPRPVVCNTVSMAPMSFLMLTSGTVQLPATRTLVQELELERLGMGTMPPQERRAPAPAAAPPPTQASSPVQALLPRRWAAPDGEPPVRRIVLED